MPQTVPTVDLNDFLDRRRQLTCVVQFQHADDIVERHRALRSAIAAAERAADEETAGGQVERSMCEEAPAQTLTRLREDLAALEVEWRERGTPVVLEERTRSQFRAATKELRAAQETELQAVLAAGGAGASSLRAEQGEALQHVQIAAALVEPAFTADQLAQLRASSATGEAAVQRLWEALNEVCAVPDVPFSQPSSPTPAGRPSASS
jgi:hypothetical protein